MNRNTCWIDKESSEIILKLRNTLAYVMGNRTKHTGDTIMYYSATQKQF